MVQKILILGHTNIGDVLHNMVILKPLSVAFPKASLSILTSPVGKTLLEDNPYLSHIFVWDKQNKHRSLRERLNLIFLLRKERFDLIINLKRGSYFAYFLGAQIWTVQKEDNTLKAKQNIHSIDRYLNILKKHNLPTNDLDMRIVYSKKDIKTIESKKPLVVFAPFSAWHAKEWEPQKLGLLAKKLSENHHKQIVFVGGEKDKIKMQAFQEFKDYFIDLVGLLSLKELAALYDKAQLAIGVDSGPFHLATNMGVPAVGLFGATSHFLGQPYFTPQYTVFCKKDLGCNPCVPGPHFLACNIYNRTTPCMEAISFEEVYQKIQKVLIDVERIRS